LCDKITRSVEIVMAAQGPLAQIGREIADDPAAVGDNPPQLAPVFKIGNMVHFVKSGRQAPITAPTIRNRHFYNRK
jgi:hypothetical protein